VDRRAGAHRRVHRRAHGPTIFETQRRPPEDALVVEVIGHQWWWEFRYPEYGIVTANQMWIPTGRPVSLQMHSADVVHSFWIPRIGGKRDVNPLPRRREGEPAAHKNYLLFNVRSPATTSASARSSAASRTPSCA
jgi:heme/copper-type cytochrome/quinol oxidase subunit 2